jgi:GWxTD domain-containing protein
MKTANNLFRLIICLLVACTGPAKRDNSPKLAELYSRADSFYTISQLDSSLCYLNQCLDLDRTNAQAHYLLGKIYLQKDGIYNRRLSAAALRDAIKSDIDNPEYHYTLGQTLEAQSFALNALDEYKITASLDSSDYRPLIRIAAIYEKMGLRYDDDKYFRNSLEASSKAAKISRDPAQFYKEASTFYQLGLFDSSAGALIEALDISDSISTTAQCWLLLGADLNALGNFDSAAVCFETGISLLDSAGRAEFEDLRFLLTSKEYAQYLNMSTYERVGAARLFWAKLDPDPTTEINERKLEHYARFIHAELTFSIPDRDIRGWKTKRGELYIRYGSPTKQEFSLGDGVNAPPYWTWTYEQFGRPAVFVFEDTFLNGDFDYPFPNKNWTADDYANNPAFLAEMLGESDPQIYSYDPGAGPLKYAYQIRQFKGKHGGTDIETFISIPYSELKYISDGDVAVSAVRWRESLGLLDYETSQSFDKIRTYRIPAGLIEDSTLNICDRQTLNGAADSMVFAISLKDTLSGHAGISSTEMGLRRFHSDRVEISDLVLARQIDQPPGKLDFERGDLHIVTNVDRRYFISQPIWLYFELYNLARGDDGKTSYAINLTISEKRSRGIWHTLKGALGVGTMKEISTSYSGGSIKTDENRVLTVDLSQLSEGEYKISLEISDLNSGKAAVATENIVVYR